MLLDLIYYNNGILRQKAIDVKHIDDSIIKLASDMVDTMNASKGVGLAAPQVGKSIRMFVSCAKQGADPEVMELGTPKVYINPVLSNFSEKKVLYCEGCLSIPEVFMDVERPYSVTVSAYNLNGELFTEDLEGFTARVVMHENDHLDGILYIDYLSKKAMKKIDFDLRNIKNTYKQM